MKQSPNIQKWLIFLLIISAVIRALIAGMFELGNDEVYYWTYAVYPDLSYFDHPPMVGWLIRIFTFNLHFQQEFFLRLASVIGGTINTWLIFLSGKKLKDELTGWYAALFYTASLYGFVITGIFILPDTPQTLFWLLALLLMLDILPVENEEKLSGRKMVRIGMLMGLGMLSKYTTAFLWLGMVLFILSNNRSWLRKKSFYLANLIILGFFSIVIVWNAMNHFISFAYQGGRAGFAGSIFNYDTFLTELGGEFLYHNPVNFILLIFMLFFLFRNRSWENDPKVKILLLSSLPLIGVFLLLSLFRATLPHWSGPGYMTLIPLLALWIRKRKGNSPGLMPFSIATALSVMVLIIGASIAQISTGFIHLGSAGKESSGMKDFSLEIYGWRQLGEKFKPLALHEEEAGMIEKGAPIVTYRWFPAANLEYYAGRSAGKHVLAIGKLEDIHKYAWINRQHDDFHLNGDAWYITSSLDFADPVKNLSRYYKETCKPDTINIIRQGKTAYCFYVYRLKNLQSKPVDVLNEMLAK
ncbi:MAG: glycosyltransferase family 39 protein [Bacteroidetes bacterium]|nr:glycosyltransferase family 39 protein [Bacteroidota bacterium]